MRRIVVVLAVLAVLGVGGVVLAWTTGPSKGVGSGESEPVASIASSAAPNVGSDMAAARLAAVTAVASTAEVMRVGMFTRGDLIDRIATTAFAGELSSATTAQVNEFIVSLGAAGRDPSELAVMEVPVSASATEVAPGRVRVDVWSVLVVSMPGTAVARQAWRTTTLDMQSVDGRWLVDGWRSEPGPSPALPPTGVVAERGEVATRLGWQQVLPGGEG
jgi:hypothetical protein